MSAHTPGRIPEMLRANISTPELLEIMERLERQQRHIQTLREALNELHANTENRQDEPFIGYVRKTCAAALEETK